jgi:hypothetical protein
MVLQFSGCYSSPKSVGNLQFLKSFINWNSDTSENMVEIAMDF